MLDDLLREQAGLLTRQQALRTMSRGVVRHRLATGRWKHLHDGVYLTAPAALTEEQRWWLAVLATGGLLAGRTALTRLGLRNLPDEHILLRNDQRDRAYPTGVVLHRTRNLSPCDIEAHRPPPCTVAARSMVDAARWARSDDQARLMVVASFQQRLVTVDEVLRVLSSQRQLRRRRVIEQAVTDAVGGAGSLPELRLLRLCRDNDLPTPTLQVRRCDHSGRDRYLDAYFEEWRLHVEIDGAHHLDPATWWDDMRRQNELWIAGDRVSRFPAWLVRDRPDEVVQMLRSALTAAGWSRSCGRQV